MVTATLSWLWRAVTSTRNMMQTDRLAHELDKKGWAIAPIAPNVRRFEHQGSEDTEEKQALPSKQSA